ncbi:unnamed protein product [Cuscuta campestris]|uniref:DUF4283 domain-containing protein n=1 Tax=Cuscuta campestris TaxID=132261 RepID=A0A484N4G1_9ASTE|nr:unnamed protein product [Cuscuta campestris]
MGKRGRPPKPIGKDTGDAIATPSIEEKVTEKEDPEVSNKKSPTGCATPIQPQPDLEIEELIATEEEAEDKSEGKKSYADVVGANPPLEIVKGFLSRIWKAYEIDDISFLREGQFIVRFHKVEDRDEIIKKKYYFMDNKPVFVQKWYPGCKVNLLERKDIPIWIQFPDLEMKYWSLSALSKLGSAIGQPIRRDRATASRVKWSYARIQVEVQINQTFPDQINFLNEEGRIITQKIKYEWAPTVCSHCNRIGHVFEMCRKRYTENTKGTGGKKIWRPKTTPQGGKDEAAPPSIPQRTETEKEDNKRDKENVEAKNPENSDDSGFLEISKKKAAKRRFLEGTEGYFNTVLKQDEKIGGNPVSWEEVRPFQDCLNLCGLEDLPFEGPRFTWTNNQDYDKRIYSKLDRVLGNINWMCNFDHKVYFKERGISDHSPMIIQKLEQFKVGHHFRFCDMWTLDPQFPLLVADVWDQEHKGYPMYQVIQKLKQLKGPLKKLNKSKFQNLDSQIDQIRTKLHIVQADQRANSSNTNLAKFEKELTQELHQKLRANFLMKCQQSKADWITYGDQDTKLFHAWVKKRRAQTHLTAIAKEDGEVVEGKTKVAKVLVEFYQNQLGRTMETEDINPNIISMETHMENFLVSLLGDFEKDTTTSPFTNSMLNVVAIVG